MDMTPTAVRLTVAEMMDRRGLNTAELAERAGIAYNTALALRRGTPRRLDLDVLAKICEALQAQPGELMIAETR